MPSRYTRDELIKRALDKVQLASLNAHDMPNGVIQPDAFCVDWLQDILDFWHHMVPYSTTVISIALNMTANVETVLAPSDFILDVRNGYMVETITGDAQSLKRMHRVPFQKFLNRKTYYQKASGVKYPYFYCVIGKDSVTSRQFIRVAPVPTQNVNATLWYYKLPAALNSEDIPDAVNDYVCEEYLRIRALEWARVYEPGTAQKFCERIVSGLRAAGLMNEPEDDEIPFDEMVFHKGRQPGLYTTYAWMGDR